MAYPAPVPDSLHQLAAQLPFGLDDTVRAGEAFQRWRTRAAKGDCTPEKWTVDVWTYCFVHRYFLLKFSARRSGAASDLDELAEQAHRKITHGHADVREPRRYPHWVSVVCKNTFLNYVRRDLPVLVSLHGEHRPLLLPAGTATRSDLGLAEKVVADAVERLPQYLRPVARLRLLEARPYKKISERTGTPVPTARSYAGRARKHLREDPAVLALLEGPAGR